MSDVKLFELTARAVRCRLLTPVRHAGSENTKNQSPTRMMFLGSMSKLNWLAMWAHKAVLNE
jgi:hypothetical protein